MHDPLEIDSARLPGYSAAVQRALAIIAFTITLLPIPVIYFGIIPAYRVHASFLLFYAPFVSLLTLCYLFYVRDLLARAMFADVLNPPQPPDPYYQEPFGERLKRGFRRLKVMLLGILPILLVITSMYCLSRYVLLLDDSVALASATYAERSAAREKAAAATEDRGMPGKRSSVDAGRLETKHPPPAGAAPADSLPPTIDSVAVRQYVLRTAEIDDIPWLVDLTVLYMGSFVALLIAVTLMALKEYAKEALGLSEHDLMFGRYYPRNEED